MAELKRLECGCLQHPEQGWRYPCEEHALPRYHSADVNKLRTQGPNAEYYSKEICPACGRVNPQGNYCSNSWLEICPTCGLVACGRLDSAHYRLLIEHNMICRSTINPRTKVGRRYKQELIDHPEREATPERVKELIKGRGDKFTWKAGDVIWQEKKA